MTSPRRGAENVAAYVEGNTPDIRPDSLKVEIAKAIAFLHLLESRLGERGMLGSAGECATVARRLMFAARREWPTA